MNAMKTAAEISAFMYHEVTDRPESSGFDRVSALPYKHGIEEFEENLDQIAEASSHVCLVDEIDYAKEQRHIVLTFDDGGKSAMHIADRIEKRGWNGHFFVTTARLNTSGFLTDKDIIELDARGHIIGSHSHTHPDIFFNLSRKEMHEEWNTSCDILSQTLQKNINTASIPGGDMNMLALETAKAAGITYLFTSEPTYKPFVSDGMICIGRVCPKKGTSVTEVRALADFSGYFRLMLIRKLKQTAKKALMPYYQWRIKRGMVRSSS